MNTKYKTVFFSIGAIFMLLLASEVTNYLSNPASPSSEILNKLFINKSITEAKKGKLDSSMFYLLLASKINIFGEYDHYRKLLPPDYSKGVMLPKDDLLNSLITNYIVGLNTNDLKTHEDQGLGRIYYNLGLVAYKSNHPEITPLFFKMAVYNNPEFASFHAELINYYFTIGKLDNVNREMDYCFKFIEAKTLCTQYRDDSLRLNLPKDVGYMNAEVDRHYNNN